ncbi:unnamed protein product [Caenorhabditis bovis]|uniref:Uncharacterized protein n=1 Tax=Caenorhabditis bovis TaxID=2654633 RepID=A0A8S1F8R9_9PELO|nr:unnamed protein product [Caenorhabditis bovis]
MASLNHAILISLFVCSCTGLQETFDPKAVDILLREIRSRLQQQELDRHPELKTTTPAAAEEVKKNEIDVEGSGSGEEIVEGSGVGDEVFPTPQPIFDKAGNFNDKEELETLTLTKLHKEAPTTIQEHYKQNPVGTLQMLQGLDIHGSSGGYHRALSGGYLPPQTYDPYNVNWHSYGEEGVKMKDKAIDVFRRVLRPNV